MEYSENQIKGELGVINNIEVSKHIREIIYLKIKASMFWITKHIEMLQFKQKSVLSYD